MADFRYFRTSFWTDPYVLDLSTSEKALFAWLFTNPHVGQIGVLSFHPKILTLETGISPESAADILNKFERDKRIIREGEHLFIVNFAKHQSTESPAMKKRICRELAALGPCRIADEFRTRYPHLLEEDPSSPDPSSLRTKKGNERKGKTDSLRQSETVPRQSPENGASSPSTPYEKTKPEYRISQIGAVTGNVTEGISRAHERNLTAFPELLGKDNR